MNAEQYLIKPEDGRNEPIKDLNNAERVVLVDKDTVGAQDLTFALCTFAAKTSTHKKHVHQHAEEVIYILSGKGMSGIGDSETVMSKGDTMFVPRGAVHWFYNPFDEPVQMIFIYTKSSLKSAGYKIVE
jgi:quercetin dioxygenase-like cupin family protein